MRRPDHLTGSLSSQPRVDSSFTAQMEAIKNQAETAQEQ